MPSVEAWARCAEPKRVIHVNLGERRQLLREFRNVLFLLRMEAQVFEQQHAAVLKRLRRRFRLRTNAIGREGHGLAQQLRQARGSGFETVFGIHLALGAAQVRGQDQPSAALHYVLNGWQGGLDARVIGDFTGVVQRHVEIHAHEDALAFYVKVTNRDFCHGDDSSFRGKKRVGQSAWSVVRCP